MTELEAWRSWHATFAVWCDPATCRHHVARLNGPDLVNGRPDGPLADVLGLATAWRARELERRARFDQLVDGLLEQAGPAAGRR